MKLLAVLLCMASAPLAAQTASGNEIAAACDHLDEADIRGGYCIGYIIGAWEGIKIGAFEALVVSGAKGTAEELDGMVNSILGICAPVSVERGQIVDIVVGYFEENPAIRHLPARSLIREAMVESFPCK